jgi:hypothetical protein
MWLVNYNNRIRARMEIEFIPLYCILPSLLLMSSICSIFFDNSQPTRIPNPAQWVNIKRMRVKYGNRQGTDEFLLSQSYDVIV